MMKIRQQYHHIYGILLLIAVVVGGNGCETKSSVVTQEKPKATELTPAEKRFNSKVVDQATFFAKRSQSIYATKKESVPWWRKLWPWDQKTKSSEPKMKMNKEQLSAKYQNTKNKKK